MAVELWRPGALPALSPASVSGVRPESWAPQVSAARIDLGGVLVDRVDLAAAVERIHTFLRSGRPHQVVTVNLDFLSIAARDPLFRQVINRADLAVADGMPLVWLSRMKGGAIPERVTGVDLVHETCRLAAGTGDGVFLLGAGPGVAERAAARLQNLYPGLRVAGVYAPPFGPQGADEDARIVRTIRAASPSILFVALGAPRQDVWIRRHLRNLDVPVAMGVGCVFDLLAGVVDRAPDWMQRSGLEWAFRLGQEPGRLWRRYVLSDLPVFGRLVAETAFSALRRDELGADARPVPLAHGALGRPSA